MVVGAAALHYGWRAGMMIAGGLGDYCRAVPLLAPARQAADRRPSTGGRLAARRDGDRPAAGRGRAVPPEILTKYVLKNPYIWLLSLCYVLVYVVRAAINDWGNLYMSETLGVDLVTANSAVTMFELGGFIGALVAGWGSDKLFNGNRGPMNLIFAAGILLSVGSLWLMPFASYVMQAACFFTIGFFRLWPADADRHGGGGVFPQRGGRRGDGLCRAVCLSWRIALRLAAGAGDRHLALERVLRGDRHRGGHLRPAFTAVFARAGAARSVTRLTFCCRDAQN